MSRRQLDDKSRESVDALLSKRRRGVGDTSTLATPATHDTNTLLPNDNESAAFVSEMQAEHRASTVSAATFLREGEGAAEDDAYEEEDDDDEWEEAFTVGQAASTTMGNALGTNVEFTVDASPAEMEVPNEAAPAPSATVSAAEQAELRRLKRKHNAKRRGRSEATHRLALLCWLSHGRLLSDQADELTLQSRLLSLLPREVRADSERAGVLAVTRPAPTLARLGAPLALHALIAPLAVLSAHPCAAPCRCVLLPSR